MKTKSIFILFLCSLFSLVGYSQKFVFKSSNTEFSFTLGTQVNGDIHISPEVKNPAGQYVSALDLSTIYQIVEQTEYTVTGEFSELFMLYNKITELEFFDMPSLKRLDFSENRLQNFNASSLPNLEYLQCFRCELTYLNVTGLTKLKELYCFLNFLPQIEFSGLPSLETINCRTNRFKKLDLSELPKLNNLDCSFNHFSVCGLDSLFFSLPDRTGQSRASIFIVVMNGDQAPFNECRTYIAIDKGWDVYDKNNSDQQPVLIINEAPFGCLDTSIPDTFASSLGINIFPMPLNDKLNIISEELITKVSIYDITGKLVVSETVNNTSFVFPTESFYSGLYVISVQTEDNVLSFKVMKE